MMPPKTVQRFELFGEHDHEAFEWASDDYVWWVFYVIHDYVWQNAATKKVEFNYDWAFGRNNDFILDSESVTYTLTANQRARAVDWEEHYNSRELHTTAMLIMHPDNERAMMMLLVDLTGDNRAGPITSVWRETSWLDPGWRGFDEYRWYENIERGWFDMFYEFWSL